MTSLEQRIKDEIIRPGMHIDESAMSNMGTDGNGKRWEDYDIIKVPLPNGKVETIDMVKLLDEQQRAKAALVHLQPAFGGLVNKLRFIYTFRVETQATDGYNLFVNPLFTDKLNLTEKCFVMAHEIMHCLLNHMRRGKNDNRKRSNIAADYECNITLSDDKGCGMDLFKYDTIKNLGAYIDRKYAGWGYEAIYADCKDNAKDTMQPKQQKGPGGDGSQQQYSADYKAGWNQAMEDYKNGKITI